jgi:hypothetical protein
VEVSVKRNDWFQYKHDMKPKFLDDRFGSGIPV